MIKQLFAPENIKKTGIKIEADNMSWPKDTAIEHIGFLTIDADNAPAITQFFGAIAVDVKHAKPFSEIAKHYDIFR